MGCDIHMRAEVRKNGVWTAVGPVFDSNYSHKEDEYTEEPYDGRNYELFAFLAGVRNQYEIVPISDPKGVPDDLSPEVKDFMDYYDHSPSWFTLEELNNADWDQSITLNGVVPADVYEYLKAVKEIPKTYSSDISGTNIVVLTEEGWHDLPWSDKIGGTRWHVRMSWKEGIRDRCSHFYEKTLSALRKLGNPEDVRIVFYFDN